MDTTHIRHLFPILKQKINQSDLVYFDNAATTQKPLAVIDAITNFYTRHNANIHRGVHTLSRTATDLFEASRKTAASFLGVANPQQIVFTSGTTDGINMVAAGLGKSFLKAGDEIILTPLEHHSNILPWQLWAQENGGHLKVAPLLPDLSIDYAALENLIGPQTKLIAITHVSNTLGLITAVNTIKAIAQKHELAWLLDGAQSAPHMPINLDLLKPDFFVCSAHKMYGPTGTGILYMDEKWLDVLPLAKTGGGTITTVSFEKTNYVTGPIRFEPGTPNIADVVAFGAALDWMSQIGMQNLFEHENTLVQYAANAMSAIPEIVMYGNHTHKAGVISFNVQNQHPFDVGTLLDKYGIAVRTGHHCTQPLMQLLKVPGTIRISFAAYNTKQEIDFFIEKLKKVIRMLQ